MAVFFQDVEDAIPYPINTLSTYLSFKIFIKGGLGMIDYTNLTENEKQKIV